MDHGLRAEARAEGQLARARAESPGAAVAWFARRRRRGRARSGLLQDAARRVRHGALEELASRRGAARIALGHQADDQAETPSCFGNVRGTEACAGWRASPTGAGRSCGPSLDVTRAEIARYLRRRSLPFVEDPSNADPRFARSRVRHHLLPLLAGENPRVREALVALAAAASGRARPILPLRMWAAARRRS